jgi:hypothetical protein
VLTRVTLASFDKSPNAGGYSRLTILYTPDILFTTPLLSVCCIESIHILFPILSFSSLIVGVGSDK